MKPETNFLLLKAIRQRGWAQVDLVREAGLTSEARLSRIIRNRSCPTPKEVARICEALRAGAAQLGFQSSDGRKKRS